MSGAQPGPAVPLIDLGAVNGPYRNALRAAFERVLATSGYSDGPEVAGFEDELAASVGTTHTVGVSSGTAALHLALRAAGIGAGDEVLLPPNTFVATAEAVVMAGATPVLVDVDPDTALLDLAAAAAAVTPRTAGIIPVHLYGQPVDADGSRALADRHGLFLLEDAAQAIGARWDGRPVGSLGDAAAFSFYPTKNLGALGQAGAVTTGDPALAHRIRLLRRHGEGPRNVHGVVGFNDRLDDLQAAFLRVKLAHLDADQDRRDAALARYQAGLPGLAGVTPLRTHPRARHAHHLLVVRVPERDAVLARLREQGVGAGVHYPTPIHLQPAFAHVAEEGKLPHAEALAHSILSLPLYPGISDEQVDRCVDTLAAAVADVTGGAS